MSEPVAFVTGATEGIGRAIAFTLGRAGWRVGVCARTPERVTELRAELGREGIRAEACPADVGSEEQVAGAVERAARALGIVDTLVNNAGIAFMKPIAELTVAEWDATMATNVRGMFLATRAVLPGMRQLGHGAVVNIASLAGRNGIVNGTAYCASKHAVLGFSRALMQEIRKENIRVIAICPGSVDTRLLRREGRTPEEARRVLAPEDVADAVLHTLRLPERALVSELDLRPANP